MWVTQAIETRAQQALLQERGESGGQEKFALYLTARTCLVEEVLPEIKAMQPTLTDHGSNHIANVLNNAEALLPGAVGNLSGTELYCLVLSILFHDVGNVLSRDAHHQLISSIYDYVRPQTALFKQEKLIVLRVTAAHCGTAQDGSKDTLKFLSDKTHLDGKAVDWQKIAAVLRFADELAEGPQRTSLFMQRVFGYPNECSIFHDYAQITEICIEPQNGRIALTYNIDVKTDDARKSWLNEKEFKQLLEFTFRRILKLNQERKYAKHYCNLLQAFRETSVVFNFWVKGSPISLVLPKLVLDDLVVPGDLEKTVAQYNPSYNLDELMAKVRHALELPSADGGFKAVLLKARKFLHRGASND